jgi:hypothetical protein
VTKKKYKRSTFIINPTFQYKFILMSILFISVTGLFYPFSFFQIISSLINKYSAANIDTSQMISVKNSIFIWFMLFHFIYTFLVAIYFLLVSHRIAGPLHKLNNYLKNLKETGSIDKIRFRENDHFKEIETSYNEAMNKIIEEKNKDFAYLSEVSTFISNISVIVPEDKKPVIAEITAKLDDMQSKFKI